MSENVTVPMWVVRAATPDALRFYAVFRNSVEGKTEFSERHIIELMGFTDAEQVDKCYDELVFIGAIQGTSEDPAENWFKFPNESPFGDTPPEVAE